MNMAEARSLVADLAARRHWIYWVDLTVCMVLGYGMFCCVRLTNCSLRPLSDAWRSPALAFYRELVFVHEIVHAGDELRWFSVIWYVVCGIPLLVPKFTYEFHQDHHASRTYGTVEDGAYVAYTSEPRWRVITLPFTALLGPVVFVVRFLVLAPLSWLTPALRSCVLTRASAWMIDTDFHRKPPPAGVPRSWLVQEFACSAYIVAMLALLILGDYSPNRLLEVYVMVALVLFVNWIRVLAAHRYESGNERMMFPEQVLDSIDHPSLPILGELWAPLGLRFHAVHHFFPNLPHHQLAEARRRLVEAILRDGGYWTTEDRSLTASIRRLPAYPRTATESPRAVKEAV